MTSGIKSYRGVVSLPGFEYFVVSICQSVFTIKWKKYNIQVVQTELALFFIDNAHVTSDIIFIVYTL